MPNFEHFCFRISKYATARYLLMLQTEVEESMLIMETKGDYLHLT